MTKRISEWLKKAVDYLKEDWNLKLVFALSIATGIVSGILMYRSYDTVPAEYEPFENQLALVQEKLDTLRLQQTAPITVKDQIMTVTISNEECSVAVKYDENFNVISTEKLDFSTHWFVACILSFVSGIAISFFACLVYIAIWESMAQKFKWMKPISKSENQ